MNKYESIEMMREYARRLVDLANTLSQRIDDLDEIELELAVERMTDGVDELFDLV